MSLRRVPSFSARPGFPAGLRVLLVENKADKEASAQLRQFGYEVKCCTSSNEAAAVIAAASAAGSPFDVLLAEASALTAKSAEKLRESVKELPTIIMSHNPKPEEIMLSIKLGVAEVLERPLCPLKLKNIWQHAVRRMMRTSSKDLLADTPLGGSSRASQELSSQYGSSSDAQHCATQAHLLADVSPATSPTSREQSQMATAGSTEDIFQPFAASTAPSSTTSSGGHRDQETRRNPKRKAREAAAVAAAAAAAAAQQDTGCGQRRASTTGDALLTPRSPGLDAGAGVSSTCGGASGVVSGMPAACTGGMPGMPTVSSDPNLACASGLPSWSCPSTASGLPPGQAWGMPLNPMAVAPGITPPIFPPPATPPVMPPVSQPSWPLMPQGPLPGMPMPGMLPLGMPGAFGMPCGAPFMPHCMPGQGLAPLPLPMLMSACGMPGGSATMCGGHEMMSPCSPCPTDPSITTASERSSQDVLGGMDDLTIMGGLSQPKMPRCESNHLLPTLEDLIAETETDMDLDLEGLSLACLPFKRVDSLDDLISQTVAAF